MSVTPPTNLRAQIPESIVSPMVIKWDSVTGANVTYECALREDFGEIFLSTPSTSINIYLGELLVQPYILYIRAKKVFIDAIVYSNPISIRYPLLVLPMLNVNMPPTYTLVGYGDFLQSTLRIPDGITHIAGDTVSIGDISLVETIVVPTSVQFIDGNAFSAFSSLKRIHFNGGAPILRDSIVSRQVMITYPFDSNKWGIVTDVNLMKFSVGLPLETLYLKVTESTTLTGTIFNSSSITGLTYRWRVNNSILSDAAQNSLRISGGLFGIGASLSCILEVTTPYGIVSSNPVSVIITAPTLTVIIDRFIRIKTSEESILRATINVPGTYTYKWKKNFIEIPNKTSSSVIVRGSEFTGQGLSNGEVGGFHFAVYSVDVITQSGMLVSSNNCYIIVTPDSYSIPDGYRVVSWNNTSLLPAAVTEGGIISVAAGKDHHLAITTSNNVVAWGDNTYGQTDVPLFAKYAGRVIKVAAGNGFSIALTIDGNVVAWGRNDKGQTNTDKFSQYNGIYKDIAVGYDHWIALTKFNNVVGFGYNTYGQYTFPSSLVLGETTIAGISAGVNCSAIMDNTQRIYLYGQNIPLNSKYNFPVAITSFNVQFGGSLVALGVDDNVITNTPEIIPTSAKVGGNITSISINRLHRLALTKAGQVISWGLYTQSTVPSVSYGAVAISAGLKISLALLPWYKLDEAKIAIANGDKLTLIQTISKIPDNKKEIFVLALAGESAQQANNTSTNTVSSVLRSTFSVPANKQTITINRDTFFNSILVKTMPDSLIAKVQQLRDIQYVLAEYDSNNTIYIDTRNINETGLYIPGRDGNKIIFYVDNHINTPKLPLMTLQADRSCNISYRDPIISNSGVGTVKLNVGDSYGCSIAIPGTESLIQTPAFCFGSGFARRCFPAKTTTTYKYFNFRFTYAGHGSFFSIPLSTFFPVRIDTSYRTMGLTNIYTEEGAYRLAYGIDIDGAAVVSWSPVASGLLLKDLGVDLPIYDIDNNMIYKFRRVQLISGPTIEGVSGTAPDWNGGWVCIWSADGVVV